eukprot:5604702-Prymnesium_polylepis.1
MHKCVCEECAELLLAKDPWRGTVHADGAECPLCRVMSKSVRKVFECSCVLSAIAQWAARLPRSLKRLKCEDEDREDLPEEHTSRRESGVRGRVAGKHGVRGNGSKA